MALAVPRPTGGLVRAKTSVGHMRDLWVPNSFDYDVFEDKFWGDTLHTLYPAAKTNGTSAAVTFTEHNVNGYLELVSGTDDNGYAGQGMGLQFSGDRGVLFECILRTPSAITGFKFECGLSDADDDAGAINAKVTPTLTAADCAVFVYDTDDNTVLDFISANAGSATATTGVLAAGVLAASTTYRFAVQIDGDRVKAWLNDNEVLTAAHTIEGGSALTPWVFCQARGAAASRTVQLHKWRVTQPAY